MSTVALVAIGVGLVGLLSYVSDTVDTLVPDVVVDLAGGGLLIVCGAVLLAYSVRGGG